MDDFEKLINASDLIEWIMETYPDWCVGDVRSIVDHIMDLPSAGPEIIRCYDCKWWEQESICEGHCHEIDLHHVDEDHYCSFAERRTDE